MSEVLAVRPLERVPGSPSRGGLIGCGYVSRFHLEAWSHQGAGRLVAVADLDESRARSAAAAWGLRAYPSPETMLAAERLDWVEVCTGPDAHEGLVTLAARHRVHVLCQKPIAPDLDTIDRMIRVVEEAGVRLMVHENWRFRPWYRAMATAVRSGVVGRPVRLRLADHEPRCLVAGGLDDQPYFATMPRLVLYEMGPHLVDAARQLLGEPESVYAVTGHAGPQAGEDSAHLVLRYGGGRVAILDLSWATAMGHDHRPEWGLFESVLEGTTGTLRTDRDGQLRLVRPGGAEVVLPVELESDPRLQSYGATQRHFLDRLRDGHPFETDIRDQRRAMSIVLAAYRSAESGRACEVGE